MSNIQAATKVADQLVARIFDQRQFTSGEITYLTREFGEKANLEENFDRILKLNQSVCVVADTDINDLCETSDKMIKNLSEKVDSLHERTERLLRLEEEQRQKEATLLVEMRAERAKVEQDCYAGIKSKLDKLKDTLAEEERELERKYLKFEENLRNSS